MTHDGLDGYPLVDDHKVEVRRHGYEVMALTGVDGIDPENDNVDVEVTFEDGGRWGATFVTLENIRVTLDRWRTTGDSRHGLYYWTRCMIVAPRLTINVILDTVDDMLADDSFKLAFEPLEPLDQEDHDLG